MKLYSFMWLFIHRSTFGILRVIRVYFYQLFFWSPCTIIIQHMVSNKIRKIIIIAYSLIALQYKNKVDSRIAKKESSIQYGYRKSGTHARVFSERKLWKLKIGNSKVHEIKSQSQAVARAHRPPGSLLPETADELIN